jgi:hypothetical protein
VISGWIVKLAVSIGLGAFLVIELGAPIVVRVQLDGTAQDAASAAASAVFRGENVEQALAAAQEVASRQGATAEKATVASDHKTVKVTLLKIVRPVLFDRVHQLDSWYHVTATASAVAQQ